MIMLTNDQLLKRKQGIGGSDVGAIFGKNRYKTPLDIYFDKINSTIIDQKMTDSQILGNLKEDILKKMYEFKTGNKVIQTSETYTNMNYDFMIANIDGLIHIEGNPCGIIEFKTASDYFKNEWGEEGTDEIPVSYLLQVAHYCLVLDMDYVDIPVLIGAHDFRIYKYEANSELEQRIIEKEYDFWHNHVIKRIPPPPLTQKEADKLFPKSLSKKTIYADNKLCQWIEKLNEIKINLKKLQKEEDAIKTIIKSNMEDAEILLAEEGIPLATWKSQWTNRLDIGKLKNECEDVYKKYLKPQESRVFRIKGDDE